MKYFRDANGLATIANVLDLDNTGHVTTQDTAHFGIHVRIPQADIIVHTASYYTTMGLVRLDAECPNEGAREEKSGQCGERKTGSGGEKRAVWGEKNGQCTARALWWGEKRGKWGEDKSGQGNKDARVRY